MKKTLTKHLFNLVFGKSVQSKRNEKGLRIVISKKMKEMKKVYVLLLANNSSIHLREINFMSEVYNLLI